jgi:hypothetical protein
MLLSFSIQNFRSFGPEEQTLNLLASKRFGIEPPHCAAVPGTDEHVLRVAALYGANGAGKSNLIRALARVQQLVLSGAPPGKSLPYRPFLLDEESRTKPTHFELRFAEEGGAFRYGICYDAHRVHEEWLDVYEGPKERNVFTRVTSEDGKVAVELGPAAQGNKSGEKLKALSKVGARPNQPFLTEVANLDDPEAQGPCRRAVKWLKSGLTVVRPDAQFIALAAKIARDKKFAEFAAQFLREASTGIAGLEIHAAETPKNEIEGLLDIEIARSAASKGVTTATGPDGKELDRDPGGKGPPRPIAIMASHVLLNEQRAFFPIREESDGSRRVLNLLPALYRLVHQGGVFVVDELERSMHPMLARKFVEFFLKAGHATPSQLIFTTHESTLLDLDLLRRDGIWFTEKDPRGATQLYSLADFKVRKDLQIEKGYLAGRFGAIPFLGGIDQLIEEQASAEAGA